MPTDEPAAWFPAKRYGWGWGPPRRWQGWVVLATYVAAMGAGPFFLNLHPPAAAFFAYVAAATAVFIAVCWWKGERPRWRWGDRDVP